MITAVVRSGACVHAPADVRDADADVPRLVARDQALALGEPREREALVLRGGQVLRGARDHALREQVVDDDRCEELVLVARSQRAPT